MKTIKVKFYSKCTDYYEMVRALEVPDDLSGDQLTEYLLDYQEEETDGHYILKRQHNAI